MSGTFIYPRLMDTVALQLREELLGLKPDEAAQRYALDHPAAFHAAVGGERADARRLAAVREEVLESLEPWMRRAYAGELTKQTRAELDQPLGRVLHRTLEIVPSDAAHDGVWSFLSLVLLPEVTVARFTEGHVDRWLGRPRNALRRTWWRTHVLGSILYEGIDGRTLGEDELVGIFERPTIATEPRLAFALAKRILGHEGPNRSEFARRLSKRVLAEMAVVEIGILDDDELELFIDGAMEVRIGQETATPQQPTVAPFEPFQSQTMPDRPLQLPPHVTRRPPPKRTLLRRFLDRGPS